MYKRQPIYLDADERKTDRTEKGTVAGRDRRQLLEAAGLLGISAFATSLFGTFERMLGVGGEASNDVRTHVNTVTRHVGVIGDQLAALEQSVAVPRKIHFTPRDELPLTGSAEKFLLSGFGHAASWQFAEGSGRVAVGGQGLSESHPFRRYVQRVD